MELTLNRIFLGSSATIGELYADREHIADTLEDRVRPEGEKVYGKTAISEGTYEVKLTYSPRFKKILPEILNVPNFSGIRIHTFHDVKTALRNRMEYFAANGCKIADHGLNHIAYVPLTDSEIEEIFQSLSFQTLKL